MQDEPAQLTRLKAALAGRYHIERELGRGGMSIVYLAEEPRHARRLALKVLRPQVAATLGSERFLREIKTTASLSHPHILPLFDSGEADGFLFYVMPYVEGESLRHRLNRERQLSVDEALRITTEIADALGFAHSRDIVHRDIKPENILLEAGHAVLTDFGIAKAVTDAGGEALTDTGLAIGTAQYMSPEQAAGSRQLDGRSDMYSLACVLYEMLTGDPPFAGSVRQAMLARKAVDVAPLLRKLRNTVPPSMEQAVARALATVPADRFETMQQFIAALVNLKPVAQEDAIVTGRPSSSVREDADLASRTFRLRPLEEEIDVFGLTHPGKTHRVNQDHFLICTIRREMYIHSTSLPNQSRLPRQSERRAFVAVVADGLGRGAWGEEASRLATEVVAHCMMHDIHSYHIADETDERAFEDAIRDAAMQCHANVAQRAREDPGAHGMATSLMLWVSMWPRGYLLQVGDSRCYVLRNGQLTQISRDQTMAQELIEPGMAPRPDAFQTHWADVRASAIGGPQAAPVVTRLDQLWGDVGLLCTQGLTNHVSDEQIRHRLACGESARQTCEELLQDALDGGGSDNITILVGRTNAPA